MKGAEFRSDDAGESEAIGAEWVLGQREQPRSGPNKQIKPFGWYHFARRCVHKRAAFPQHPACRQRRFWRNNGKVRTGRGHENFIQRQAC